MTDFTVSLDVKDSHSDASTHYVNVRADGGQDYSFKYSGGSDGYGGITEIIGSGSSKITISVNDHPRFHIVSCTFIHNEKGDLSCVISADKKNVVITDSDVDAFDGYYKVVVKDNNAAQALVPCDPPIKNKNRN